MYINPVVSGKRTLGSISCNPTTYRSLRLIPLNWVPLELLQDSDSILATIAPHWSSSYPEYLNQNQTSEEQRNVVWSRLRDHRTTVAKRLSREKERYLAARRELNPRTTQAESSQEPLSLDKWTIITLNGWTLDSEWLRSDLRWLKVPEWFW